MNRKKIVVLCLIIVTVIAAFTAANFARHNGRESYISRALASKMLTLLETDKISLSEAEDGEWYEKYIYYAGRMKSMDLSEKTDMDRFASGSYTYDELKKYFACKNIDVNDVSEAIGRDISKSSGKITCKHFTEIYDYLIALSGNECRVTSMELTIAGTPANSDQAERWQCFTDRDAYGFEGLKLDKYIDCRILAYVNGNEIVYVKSKISDEVTYRNVWLEKGEDTQITAYIGSMKKIFNTGKLTADFDMTLGDIYISKGKVKSVTLKKETINGKVLMADSEKIEIEGYGVLELDDNFRVYKTYGTVEEVGMDRITVGYDLADFVVADGRVCGAVISRVLNADNIRVLIMTTGYTGFTHERVSLTGTGSFTVKYGDCEECYKAGDIVDIYKDSAMLSCGRAIIESDNDEDRIKVLSVDRTQGNPQYRGRLEVVLSDDGIVLINEVLIEEYLYAVVPSEMPVRFGVEALKVQAVCARSYAYRQLLNQSYAQYGAHVDDSVNFQVYNNVCEQDDSTQAVRETYGEVASYNGNPITTYYYSTSCGHTSDNSVWGGNPGSAPYLVSKRVNQGGEHTDLSDEDTFKEYIETVCESDFDYGFGYYRWSVVMPFSEITKSVNEYIYSRYCANPGKIQVLRNDTWVSEPIKNVGNVVSLEITGRSSGGAITSMIIKGTDETVKVENELNIRYLLCPRDNPIRLLKGDTTTFYILPSAYCRFEEYEDSDGTCGYVIKGGGYGHGIGMSQNAVSNMVAAGMDYREILGFFFEGMEIMNVYDGE